MHSFLQQHAGNLFHTNTSKSHRHSLALSQLKPMYIWNSYAHIWVVRTKWQHQQNTWALMGWYYSDTPGYTQNFSPCHEKQHSDYMLYLSRNSRFRQSTANTVFAEVHVEHNLSSAKLIIHQTPVCVTKLSSCFPSWQSKANYPHRCEIFPISK